MEKPVFDVLNINKADAANPNTKPTTCKFENGRLNIKTETIKVHNGVNALSIPATDDSICCWAMQNKYAGINILNMLTRNTKASFFGGMNRTKYRPHGQKTNAAEINLIVAAST